MIMPLEGGKKPVMQLSSVVRLVHAADDYAAGRPIRVWIAAGGGKGQPHVV